jgi:simple sugar transport system ATP-binding protein
MTSSPVLILNGLSKTFGSVQAADSISLELFRGEVLALLGENGAGKTTLMNMLFGHYMPDGGTIDIIDDSGYTESLPLGNPQASIAAGIGMVHQHFTLAENLDALDNIMLGSEKFLKIRRNKSQAVQKVQKIMNDSGLVAPMDVAVGKLTVGERQRVEILKALYQDVKILVLDEPTAVLTPQEADKLFENITAMTRNGLSVIFISHKLREVLAFSNRIAVLRHGKKVGEISSKEANERKIARLMVGEDTKISLRKKIKAGAPVLELDNLTISGSSKRESISNVNLSVKKHEILGIAGISGNGQTVLANAISGLVKPSSGKIKIDGKTITSIDPSNIIQTGVGRIPEDRHKDGIVGQMSVAENMIIEDLNSGKIQSRGLLDREAIMQNCSDLSSKYDVRGPGPNAPARLLSGGNIQKLILARVFEASPKLILANQPTRGLDLGAAADVANRLLEARQRGSGVILISEDLDEILSLSDRIMVIYDGKLRTAETHNRESLGLMMAGEVA